MCALRRVTGSNRQPFDYGSNALPNELTCRLNSGPESCSRSSAKFKELVDPRLAAKGPSKFVVTRPSYHAMMVRIRKNSRWRGWRDSNSQIPVLETGALPIEPHPRSPHQRRATSPGDRSSPPMTILMQSPMNGTIAAPGGTARCTEMGYCASPQTPDAFISTTSPTMDLSPAIDGYSNGFICSANTRGYALTSPVTQSSFLTLLSFAPGAWLGAILHPSRALGAGLRIPSESCSDRPRGQPTDFRQRAGDSLTRINLQHPRPAVVRPREQAPGPCGPGTQRHCFWQLSFCHLLGLLWPSTVPPGLFIVENPVESGTPPPGDAPSEKDWFRSRAIGSGQFLVRASWWRRWELNPGPRNPIPSSSPTQRAEPTHFNDPLWRGRLDSVPQLDTALPISPVSAARSHATWTGETLRPPGVLPGQPLAAVE